MCCWASNITTREAARACSKHHPRNPGQGLLRTHSRLTWNGTTRSSLSVAPQNLMFAHGYHQWKLDYCALMTLEDGLGVVCSFLVDELELCLTWASTELEWAVSAAPTLDYSLYLVILSSPYFQFLFCKFKYPLDLASQLVSKTPSTLLLVYWAFTSWIALICVSRLSST